MITKLSSMKVFQIISALLLTANLLSCHQSQTNKEQLKTIFDSIDSASINGIPQTILQKMDSIAWLWHQFYETGDSSLLHRAIAINDILLKADTTMNGMRHHIEMRRVLYQEANNPQESFLSLYYPNPGVAYAEEKCFYEAMRMLLLSGDANQAFLGFEKTVTMCDSLLSDRLNYRVVLLKADAQTMLDKYDVACKTIDDACAIASANHEEVDLFNLERHKESLKDFKTLVESYRHK